jgi:hypothetical protein
MSKDTDMKVLLKYIPAGTNNNDTEVLLDLVTDEILIRPPNFYSNKWELRMSATELEESIAAARRKEPT